MRITKLSLAVTWLCGNCKLPISHNVEREYPTTDATHDQIIEEGKLLLEPLGMHFRKNGHDRTQHAPTCPEYTALRIKT